MFDIFKKYHAEAASKYFNHCSSLLSKLIVTLEHACEKQNNDILEDSRKLFMGTAKELRQLEEKLELIKARKEHANFIKRTREIKRLHSRLLADLSAQNPEAKNTPPALPPNSFPISLLISSTYSEDIILNMEELFDIWVGRYGNKKARRIFKLQMFGVIFHHWIKPIKKLLITAASYLGLTSFYELFK